MVELITPVEDTTGTTGPPKTLVRRLVDYLVPFTKNLVKVLALGAAVGGLTAIANAAPAFGAEFDINPFLAGQVTSMILLARDALKTKGG